MSLDSSKLQEISESPLPEDSARDFLNAHRDLSDSEISEVMAAGEPVALQNASDEMKDVLYEIASERSGSSSAASTLNDYRMYSEVVLAVRKAENRGAFEEESTSILLRSVLDSANPEIEAGRALQKNPEISLSEARKLIEVIFAQTVNDLLLPAREKIFKTAYDRESAEGWVLVLREYSDIARIVDIAKAQPLIYETPEKFYSYSDLCERVESTETRALEHERLRLDTLKDSVNPDSSLFYTLEDMIYRIDDELIARDY